MTDRWEEASLWATALPTPSSAEVPGSRPEVIVVGAGITGLVTATVLHRAGLEVLVLERHGIGGVTTRGSTGKLSVLQGDVLAQIARYRGPDAAGTYAAASLIAAASLRALIRELDIDCDLTDATDHTYATEEVAAEHCREVHRVAMAAGLPVRWVEDTELPLPIIGAVQLDGQAHLDPAALCAGLAAHLPAGTVVERAPVVDIEEDRDGVTVTLASGGQVSADHVVVATLGPIHDPALLSTRCEARRSYAIAAPHPEPPVGTHLSVDEAARSIRPATVNGQPGIVVGGAGHVVGELGDRSASQRWEDLERFATSILGAAGATHRWVAHDLIPSDHVPFIGPISPGASRRWVATGFQKWGISTAHLAADLLLGELEGSPREWAPLFDPRRVAPSLTTKLVEDGARAVRHLVLDRLDDVVHRRAARPRCTHLGCVLAFDDDEQTWDCPCHGSRFTRAGEVICGPASADID